MKAKDALRDAPLTPGVLLEVLVEPDQLTLFDYSRNDSIAELVEELKALGLEVRENFNSPCG